MVNRSGDIYITDYENSRVRIVTANTGIVTTLAGSGTCATGVPPFNVLVCQGGFGGDGGPAKNATLNHAAAGIGRQWESLHRGYDQSPDTAG